MQLIRQERGSNFHVMLPGLRFTRKARVVNVYILIAKLGLHFAYNQMLAVLRLERHEYAQAEFDLEPYFQSCLLT